MSKKKDAAQVFDEIIDEESEEIWRDEDPRPGRAHQTQRKIYLGDSQAGVRLHKRT